MRVLKRCQQFCFASEPLKVFFLALMHQFDSDLLMGLLIIGKINFGHSSPCQAVTDLVASNGCFFQHIFLHFYDSISPERYTLLVAKSCQGMTFFPFLSFFCMIQFLVVT